MLEMDFTDTQLLLHANIKYCARTLILRAFVLRALVYVLVTFFVLFVLKHIFLVFLLCFGRYFFVKSTGYGPRHRQTVK